MLQISDAVREIVAESEEVSYALNNKFLNFSAYAKQILKVIELKSKKQVKLGSIVVALSRIEKEKKNSIVTEVKIDNITTQSPLVEITYDRSGESIKMIKNIQAETSEFLTITQGTDEITIICTEKTRAKFKLKPKVEINNLVAISMRFSEKYIDEPNVIYSLLRKLAVKRINVLEVVSTYTELTILVKLGDLERGIQSLSNRF